MCNVHCTIYKYMGQWCEILLTRPPRSQMQTQHCSTTPYIAEYIQ